MQSFSNDSYFIVSCLDPPNLSQCLNDIQPAIYDSILTVKRYAPGNPDPDVTFQLWDENNYFAVQVSIVTHFISDVTRHYYQKSNLIFRKRVRIIIGHEKRPTTETEKLDEVNLFAHLITTIPSEFDSLQEKDVNNFGKFSKPAQK